MDRHNKDKPTTNPWHEDLFCMQIGVPTSLETAANTACENNDDYDPNR